MTQQPSSQAVIASLRLEITSYKQQLEALVLEQLRQQTSQDELKQQLAAVKKQNIILTRENRLLTAQVRKL